MHLLTVYIHKHGSGCSRRQGRSWTRETSTRRGSFANLALLAQTPEGRLHEWVDANYTRVADKANGTKLEDLYTAYTAMAPPVHTKVLGKILFSLRCSSLGRGRLALAAMSVRHWEQYLRRTR